MADRDAKQAVRDFKKAMKGRPSMAERKKALDALAVGSNKALVKPLAQVVETDKMVTIRRFAAEALSLQPEKQARPAILKLLDNDKVQDAPPVLAALVDGLSRCGYRSKDWDTVERLFGDDFAAPRVPLQESVLALAKAHKEKQSVKLLLDNLDEPAPANVDDPSNPPASYWEARWKAWRAWRGQVQEALFAITGQRFSTAEEAKNWLKKNPLK